ncbi:nitrogenase component 1 [Mesosutterella sp. AGMB02718]|uniref:Nitrogenase component 1 n=1 Tax=Mesosutterella faecium TaxID=2925194 RepID=A0ABT7IPB9_9BURK|nr:nitrogenase component 1 [Mesosutterella sp. AGMB02718]MDL2060235.1 nitrogenase component 1 [Mesosutterella sp. AGMB02718]
MPLLTRAARPDPVLSIGEAAFPAPFSPALEYSAPARGPWTIMHLGLLVPETHIVFVCAEACLRGVVLSAAEVRALDRFSTITIEDSNLLEGNTEEVLIEGVGDILKKIAYRPRAVIVYTSCVHEFIGTDLTFTFERLRALHPGIDFTDGYMTPILRKRISPDACNRRQIYTLLRRREDLDEGVTVYGDVVPPTADSDLARIVRASGRPFRTITAARTYGEYQELARSKRAIAVNPVAGPMLDWARQRLGQETSMFSCGFGLEENRRMLAGFARELGATFDPAPAEERLEKSLRLTRAAVGGAPVALDYTAATRPLSLARFLLESGFNVTDLYCDAFQASEKGDFEWLQARRPELRVHPTVHPGMVFAAPRRAAPERPVLAIGQKAAFFTGTDRFVNMIEGGGMDGISGMARMLELMAEAFRTPRSARDLIQVKALGCTRNGCL